MTDKPSTAATEPPGKVSDDDDLVRAIIDTIPVLAWTARADGSIDYINDQWLEFTGLPAERALDWGWIEATHVEDRDRVTAAWQAAISTGHPAEAEIRLRRADGTYLWFLARAVALRDSSGQVLKWYGTSTEVEARRRAEQALRASELSFREIIDSVPGMLSTTTPEGQPEFVNRPLMEFFGVGIDELREWRQSEYVHPEDLPGTIEAMGRGFSSSQPFTHEPFRVRRVDGVYRRIAFRAAPLLDQNGKVVRWYGVLTDIEEQKLAESELAMAREQLSRAMRLAAVSELAASIAQQVTHPLQRLVEAGGSCRESLSSTGDIAQALVHADRIASEASAAAGVVRRIRELFRQEPGRREILNLNDVIEEVMTLMGDELHRCGTRLNLDLQRDLPPVTADRMQLLQLVLNLAHSSLEAMDGADGAGHRLGIVSRQEAGEVVVRVSNSGAGPRRLDIPVGPTLESGDEDAMRLGVCRSILQSHGGRLWAMSDAPSGATLAFALPFDAVQRETPV